MNRPATFHLGIHCLQKCPSGVSSQQRVKYFAHFLPYFVSVNLICPFLISVSQLSADQNVGDYDHDLKYCKNFLLTLCIMGNFAFFIVCCFFFSTFKKIIPNKASESQTVWIQIRLTFWKAWSQSKLLAKVMSRWQVATIRETTYKLQKMTFWNVVSGKKNY